MLVTVVKGARVALKSDYIPLGISALCLKLTLRVTSGSPAECAS